MFLRGCLIRCFLGRVFEWVFLRGCLSRFVFYKDDEVRVKVTFKIDLKLTTVAGGENSYSNSP